MDKKKLGTGVGIGATLAVTAALAVGAYTMVHSVGQNANADPATYTGPVATSVAPPAQDDAAAQSIYDQQIAQAKAQAEADAKAAADAAAAKAAAQAAAEAAAKRAAAPQNTSGPVRCPAGSQANSNDGVNDTSCFPTKCFSMNVDPSDPASADCLVAFKP